MYTEEIGFFFFFEISFRGYYIIASRFNNVDGPESKAAAAESSSVCGNGCTHTHTPVILNASHGYLL